MTDNSTKPQTPENKDRSPNGESLNSKSGFSIANILDAKSLSLQEALKTLSKDLHISTSGQLLSQGATTPSSQISGFKETSPGTIPVKTEPLFQSQNQISLPGPISAPGNGSLPNCSVSSPGTCGAKQTIVPLTPPQQPVLTPAATAAALASMHPFILSCTPTEALMQQAGLLKTLGAIPHHVTSGVANPLATAAAGVPLPPSVAPLAETMINDPIAAAAFLKWYSPWAFLAAGASGPAVAGVSNPFYPPPLFSTGIHHLATCLKTG